MVDECLVRTTAHKQLVIMLSSQSLTDGHRSVQPGLIVQSINEESHLFIIVKHETDYQDFTVYVRHTNVLQQPALRRYDRPPRHFTVITDKQKGVNGSTILEWVVPLVRGKPIHEKEPLEQSLQNCVSRRVCLLKMWLRKSAAMMAT